MVFLENPAIDVLPRVAIRNAVALGKARGPSGGLVGRTRRLAADRVGLERVVVHVDPEDAAEQAPIEPLGPAERAVRAGESATFAAVAPVAAVDVEKAVVVEEHRAAVVPAAAVVLVHQHEFAGRIERATARQPGEAGHPPKRMVGVRSGQRRLVVVADVGVVRIRRSRLAEAGVEDQAVEALIFRRLRFGHPFQHLGHLDLCHRGIVRETP